MADRSIKVIVGAQVGGLVAGMRTAQGAVANFGKNADGYIQKNAAGISALSSTVGLLGAAAVAGAGLAVGAFARFDQGMSNVKATGAATASQMDLLRDAAMQAGRDTAYSATEAAAGIEALLKAGVSAEDVLAGGLTGALDLAAAGELEVGEAAEIAATAMTQFGLSGEDVTHIADLLAAGAGKAQGDVTDLAQAMKQSGLVASQTGLSIEETTGALSAFASAGLLGSDAGTSFKTMLQRLSAPSGEAASLMEELGINAYDAQGNFVGLSEFAGQLTTALGDMTPAQRNAAMATIFGSDAVRAASVLYDQGAQGVRNWIKAVDDQGYAAQVASDRLDNLMGDLKIFAGSVETALIGAGEGGSLALRGIVQGATDAVNALSKMPPEAQTATVALVGGAGLVALGVAGLGKLTVGLSNTKSALAGLGISMKTATITAGALGAALGVGAAAFAIWAQKSAEAEAAIQTFQETLGAAGETTDQTMQQITDALSSGTDSWVDGAATYMNLADEMGIATEDLIGYILGEEDAILRVRSAMDVYAEGDSFWGKLLQQRAADVGELRRGLDGKAGALTEAEKRTLDAARAEEAAGIATDELTGATGELEGALQPTTTALEDQADALREQQDELAKSARGALDARAAQNKFEESIDNARKVIEENGKGLSKNTAKGRENRAAIDEIARSGWDLIDAQRAQGASEETLRDSMRRTRRKFIDAATAAGMSKDKARELANELGLIPKNVRVDIEANDFASGKIDAVRDHLRALDGSSATAYVKTVTLGQRAMATGGLVGFAGGGTVPGTPPTDPMRDNVLARNVETGALYALRSREYVVSQPAVEKYGVSAMEAINAGRVPKNLLVGFAGGGQVPGFASGGSVAGVVAGADGSRVVVNVNNHYPQAEPTSITVNRALQTAALLGLE